jgi:hypothetical protein
VTGRILVTARCRRKGHVLAELAAGDPLRVLVPHHAVGTAKGGRIVNRRGGPVEEPLDRSMSWMAMCSCGVHPVSGRELANAADDSVAVIVLDLVLL